MRGNSNEIVELVANALSRGYSGMTIFGMVLEEYPEASLQVVRLAMKVLANWMSLVEIEIDELGQLEALCGPIIAAGAANHYPAAVAYMAEHGDEEAKRLVSNGRADEVRRTVAEDLDDRVRRGELSKRPGGPDGASIYRHPDGPL